MANLPEINLADLHEAIGQEIADAFPSATVAAYGRPGEKLTVPAITFELDSIEPDEPSDVGSEQLQVRLRFTAYCIHSYKQGNKLAVRVLAANLARFLRGKRWGEPVSAAAFVAADASGRAPARRHHQAPNSAAASAPASDAGHSRACSIGDGAVAA